MALLICTGFAASLASQRSNSTSQFAVPCVTPYETWAWSKIAHFCIKETCSKKTEHLCGFQSLKPFNMTLKPAEQNPASAPILFLRFVAET